jgi:alkylation response protein AidB-like acyl-CoA dehydrogenase
MDLTFSAEEEAFRQEVRAFIAEAKPKLPQGMGDAEAGDRSKEDYLAWHKLLYKKGWVAPLWPQQYGGTGWNVTQRYIFNEETANAEMPTTLPFGLNMVAPVIFTYGNDAQKKKYLPRILSGEDWWCQGYSEPGSGSDLASLRTKAVREGDFYIVNGQKTWTTLAQFADWIFCLVRTNSEVKQQEGISFLLIDMKTPGITVKPIIVLDGAREVNEVFFDNVKVPVENRVGEENKGWTYAKFLLVNERSGIAGVARSKKAVERLKEIGRA